MLYNPTRDALYRPYTMAPLDPVLFKDKKDALCAELSRLVYFAFPPAQSDLPLALAAHGFAGAIYFEDATTNTQAFAAVDLNGTAFVLFRGTETGGAADLVTDAAILRKAWDRGGRVHRGFANAYDSNGSVFAHDSNGLLASPFHNQGLNLRGALAKWIGLAKFKRLLASGHSLGAALATLFASDHPMAELVTIGSPAVGDGDFAALFDGRDRQVRRYRDCCDLVTRVPPALFGYRHTKGEIYIDRDGKPHNPAPENLRILADRAEGAVQYVPLALARWDTVKLRDMADHAPINYVSAMLGLRQPI